MASLQIFYAPCIKYTFTLRTAIKIFNRSLRVISESRGSRSFFKIYTASCETNLASLNLMSGKHYSTASRIPNFARFAGDDLTFQKRTRSKR